MSWTHWLFMPLSIRGFWRIRRSLRADAPPRRYRDAFHPRLHVIQLEERRVLNVAPVGVEDDFYTVAEGGTLTADDVDGTATLDINDNGVLVNDTDDDLDPLTAVQFTDPSNGTLNSNADVPGPRPA